jgi:hypothetical protein
LKRGTKFNTVEDIELEDSKLAIIPGVKYSVLTNSIIRNPEGTVSKDGMTDT